MDLMKPTLEFLKTFTFNSFGCGLCGKSHGLLNVLEHIDKCENPLGQPEIFRTYQRNDALWKLKFNEFRSMFMFVVIGGKPYENDECVGCEDFAAHQNKGCFELDRTQTYMDEAEKICKELVQLHLEFINSHCRCTLEVNYPHVLKNVDKLKDGYLRLKTLKREELAKELQLPNNDDLPKLCEEMFSSMEMILKHHKEYLKSHNMSLNYYHEQFCNTIQDLIESDLNDFDIYSDELIARVNDGISRNFDERTAVSILRNDERPAINKLCDESILLGDLEKEERVVLTTTFEATNEEWERLSTEAPEPYDMTGAIQLPSHKERMQLVAVGKGAVFLTCTSPRFLSLYACAKSFLHISLGYRNNCRSEGISKILSSFQSKDEIMLRVGIGLYNYSLMADNHINYSVSIMSYIINRAARNFNNWPSPLNVEPQQPTPLKIVASAELRKLLFDHLLNGSKSNEALIEKIESGMKAFTPDDAEFALVMNEFLGVLKKWSADHTIVFKSFSAERGTSYNDIIEQNFAAQLLYLSHLDHPVPPIEPIVLESP